jgi:hypothetical protein
MGGAPRQRQDLRPADAEGVAHEEGQGADGDRAGGVPGGAAGFEGEGLRASRERHHRAGA